MLGQLLFTYNYSLFSTNVYSAGDKLPGEVTHNGGEVMADKRNVENREREQRIVVGAWRRSREPTG